MKMIMLGAPGAGKGTQADIISKKLGIPTISTGNMLREAMRKGTPVGLAAKELIEKGMLVSDDIIIGIVSERLSADDCSQGYILDGVPRTIAQAETLESAGIEFDAVISIEIDDSAIEERMTGRRTCSKCSSTYHVVANPPAVEGVCDSCGGELTIRADDAPETVRARLKVYHDETEPLKDFYKARGKLKEVCGTAGVEEITEAILKALEMAE